MERFAHMRTPQSCRIPSLLQKEAPVDCRTRKQMMPFWCILATALHYARVYVSGRDVLKGHNLKAVINFKRKTSTSAVAEQGL